MSVIKAKKKKQKSITGFANWLFSYCTAALFTLAFLMETIPDCPSQNPKWLHISEIKIEPRSFTILWHFGK